MANNVGVRQYLQSQGIASNDIAYDKNTGYVTAKGQNFIKPAANLAGTTYDSQQNLDSAYSNYLKPKPVILPDGSTGQTGGSNTSVNDNSASNTGSNPGTSQSTQYTNPYTQQIADLMKHLSESNAALSQPVDVYSTPQYAAAQASQQRLSGDSIRHANESAAGAGLGHSTIMTDRSQKIQNDSDAYLTTQLVPQIISQIQQEKQQAYQNEQAQFNNILGLSDRADTQHQNEINNKYTEAGLTGSFNPSGMTMDQINSEMAQNSAEYAKASPERQQQLHDRNIELGKLLGKTYDSKTGTYSNGQGFVGLRTVTGQQLDNQVSETAYNHARDSLLDKRYQTEFDHNVKQDGLEYALKVALQKHQISNDNAQIAISQQNADTSAANAVNSKTDSERSRLMDIWKATGVAPEGIAGVKAGTPIYEKPLAGDKPKITDYKLNPEFAKDVAFLKSNPTSVDLLESNPQPFIDDYGYDGYLALRKAAGLDD